MHREDLVAMGISEENIEKIMADHAKAVQSANAKVNQYKEKAEKADKLQNQLDELNNQNLTDLEKANKELEKAMKEIADLRKNNAIRDLREKAMSDFKITSDQARTVVRDDGSFDTTILGQIIVEKERASATAKEQEIARNAGNPESGNNVNGNGTSKGAEMAQKYNQNNVIAV